MRDGDGWRRQERVPRTKLLRPVVPLGVPLDRALLEGTARAITSTPITLITGQAGAGKTPLAAEAATHTGLPVAWATFEADDDDVARSLHLLTAAIATVVPEGCPGASELLRTDRPAAADARQAAGVLVNDVLAAEPPLFVLVLDDVQVLRRAARSSPPSSPTCPRPCGSS